MLWWELEEVVTDIRVGAVSTFPRPRELQRQMI